jgi:hypothetical protein
MKIKRRFDIPLAMSLKTRSRLLCISQFYMPYSNVNEISYFKNIANGISKRLLSFTLKVAL